MKRYDPSEAPDSRKWLALDEGERMLLIKEYHESSGVDLPSPDAHACMHLALENQLASENPPAVKSTLQKLIERGVERHEALHAIATAFAVQISNMMNSTGTWSSKGYESELERIASSGGRSH